RKPRMSRRFWPLFEPYWAQKKKKNKRRHLWSRWKPSLPLELRLRATPERTRSPNRRHKRCCRRRFVVSSARESRGLFWRVNYIKSEWLDAVKITMPERVSSPRGALKTLARVSSHLGVVCFEMSPLKHRPCSSNLSSVECLESCLSIVHLVEAL